MEIERTWFVNKGNDDVMTICDFIKELPNRIELFIKSTNLNEVADKMNDENLSYASFEKAFTESKYYFESNYLISLRYLKLDKIYSSPKKPNKYKLFSKGLESAGLTKEQLKVKIAMLNKMWLDVYDYINKYGIKIIEFSSNELVKLIRKFMTLLNSFISSIVKAIGPFFPGLESIKEIKDLLEGYFDLAERFV